MPLDLPRGFHLLEVADLRRETEDAVSLSLSVPPDAAPLFRFIPGQYLTLRTMDGGEELRRSYSICSGPGEPLRIAVKRVPDGRFSAWAHEVLRPGHLLQAMPPQGRFTLPPATGPRHVLLVAAGSGITPVLSVLKHALAHEPDTRLSLFYGSRTTAGILFREELEALKDRHMSRLAVSHVLSREAQDIPVLHGRLSGERVLALLAGQAVDTALLCGPADMIDGVSAALAGAGLPPAAILSERFTPAGQPVRRPPAAAPSPAERPFAVATVVADGVSTAVPMAEGETVLDAALRAGLDLPFSCRAGMCSTCRARITEGTAAMDVNYGLEPWETAAGYTLTCQARPSTDRLTVDYDQV